MIAVVPDSFGSTLMERHVPGEPHEYSSTQVNLNGRVAQLQRQLAAAIPDEDLAEDGRETKPHVTVKFGIHGDNVAAVRRALAGEGPIRLRFGKTSMFPNGESGSGDVVKVDVISPDLHRLNRKIAAAVRTTDTHPEYKPHLTIAYVKPGRGKRYVGLDAMEGLTVTVDTVMFSDRFRQMHPIQLGGRRAREFNSCHDPATGRFCSGSSTRSDKGPPAVGPRIGFVAPDGNEFVAKPTGGALKYGEDHTDMVRRLLNDENKGIRQALENGYIRYWVRRGELALNFRAGNVQTARRAVKFVEDNYQHGDRLYLDIEGAEGLLLGKFFDNVREANETIRRAGGQA